jgi:hypothetical protein
MPFGVDLWHRECRQHGNDVKCPLVLLANIAWGWGKTIRSQEGKVKGTGLFGGGAGSRESDGEVLQWGGICIWVATGRHLFMGSYRAAFVYG